MTLKEFRDKIKTKDIESNRTYLSLEIGKFRYGQSYQNTVNSIEGMKDNFTVYYYDQWLEDSNPF